MVDYVAPKNYGAVDGAASRAGEMASEGVRQAGRGGLIGYALPGVLVAGAAIALIGTGPVGLGVAIGGGLLSSLILGPAVAMVGLFSGGVSGIGRGSQNASERVARQQAAAQNIGLAQMQAAQMDRAMGVQEQALQVRAMEAQAQMANAQAMHEQTMAMVQMGKHEAKAPKSHTNMNQATTKIAAETVAYDNAVGHAAEVARA